MKVIACVVVGALLLSATYSVVARAMNTTTDKVNSLFNMGYADDTSHDDGGDFPDDEVISPYLTFQGANSFSIKTTSKWDGTMEYSTDKINWSTWNGSSVSSKNGKLYFRGKNNTRVSSASSGYSPWIITGTEVE